MDQLPNLAEPMAEPRGPRLLVPVRVFFREDHRWTFDFAATCQVRTADRLGLSGVRVEAARVVTGTGAFLNVSGVLGELQESARYLSLLLRDGLSARELGHRLHPHIGVNVVSIGGGQGFCRNASAALLMAAEHAESQLFNSAAAELGPVGALSQMG